MSRQEIKRLKNSFNFHLQSLKEECKENKTDYKNFDMMASNTARLLASSRNQLVSLGQEIWVLEQLHEES